MVQSCTIKVIVRIFFIVVIFLKSVGVD
jgi:hypothetical protein